MNLIRQTGEIKVAGAKADRVQRPVSAHSRVLPSQWRVSAGR